MKIRVEHFPSSSCQQLIDRLLNRFTWPDNDCQNVVTEILDKIRREGDSAVISYTREFDAPGMDINKLKVTGEEFEQAEEKLDNEFIDTLKFAAQRIREFHQREVENSWFLTRNDGAVTGRMVRPVDSAGLYVPGGQGGLTPLISSVLMNGIPAEIAGVPRRVMVTPPNPNCSIHPALLAAAREIGVSEVYKIGSAWAIGALAFGTESIPKVDVIVGPGNRYVTEAKRQIMGRVRIDMIAGPSEVLIVADDTSHPAYLASDMLAQAEHDPQALALLLTTSEKIANSCVNELEKQLSSLNRRDIARESLEKRGAIIIVKDLETAVRLANDIAIEHLELQIANHWEWLPKINHGGAVFLGSYTPEAAGDYVAGPNHVLPTMGTARISSALGVETFYKKISVISYSRQALSNDSEHIQRLAKLEGLDAHGNSVAVRVEHSGKK